MRCCHGLNVRPPAPLSFTPKERERERKRGREGERESTIEREERESEKKISSRREEGQRHALVG